MRSAFFAGACLLGIAHAGEPVQWNPLLDGNFDGLAAVSAVSNELEIAVGASGLIVHYVDGVGTSIPSGTTNDLLAVHAVAVDFAVASGVDSLLHWDGESWSPLLTAAKGGPVALTPVWSPSTRDLVVYQERAVAPDTHRTCLLDPTNPEAIPRCETFDSPVIEYCGQAGDVKSLHADGSIRQLGPTTVSVLHAQPDEMTLNLVAAFQPPQACLPGPAAPPELFAINRADAGDEFWRFDGTAWSREQQATAGHRLVAMTGILGVELVAVGRMEDASRADLSMGVVWSSPNGRTWSQDELPIGTAWLTIASRLLTTTTRAIFRSSFEPDEAGFLLFEDPIEFRIRGVGGSSSRRGLQFDVANTQLRLDKYLVDPVPNQGMVTPGVQAGTELHWRIEVENLGPRDINVFPVTLHDVYRNQVEFSSIDCGFSPAGPEKHLLRIFNLPVGQTKTCNVTLIATEDERRGSRNPDDWVNTIFASGVFDGGHSNWVSCLIENDGNTASPDDYSCTQLSIGPNGR